MIQNINNKPSQHWLIYPAPFQHRLEALLHQQMWLFGQDICRTAGNLLYAYGFTHQKAPSRGQGSAMYTLREGAGEIALWGWGVWYGWAGWGAIFVHRYQTMAQYTAVSTLSHRIHRHRDLPRLSSAVNTAQQLAYQRQLLGRLCLWLADYEVWVLAEYGRGWRQAALAGFKSACTPLTDIESISLGWRALAEDTAVLPAQTAHQTKQIQRTP